MQTSQIAGFRTHIFERSGVRVMAEMRYLEVSEPVAFLDDVSSNSGFRAAYVSRWACGTSSGGDRYATTAISTAIDRRTMS